MKTKQLGFFLIYCLLIFSCTESNLEPLDGEVAFYLLESYETAGDSVRIIPSSVITEEEPLIRYSDILSYNRNNHEFWITEDVSQRLFSMETPLVGRAFGVKANDELIYTGYFWPAYSSAVCMWVVIEPSTLEIRNRMRVQLGYPYSLPDENIPDDRNDERILSIFLYDDKLIQ